MFGGKALGDLKIALRGGGGDMDARRRRGGGVGEKGFRVGPFVLCKNGCWRRRCRNTKFYCLRQVHLTENLPQATHTQNRVNTT